MTDSGTIEVKGLEERIKQIGQLSMKNPVMRRRINEVIKRTLTKVRKALQSDARAGLQMDGDPRNAYKAVRMAVYRRLFGGQVNILQSRKAKEGRLYEPPRHPSHRGGNRTNRPKGGRTEALMSYQGTDRGFILRFLNAGTNDRSIHSMGGHDLKTAKKGGNRGKINARNWFGPRSQREMENAAANIDRIIDDIITGIMY